MQEVPGENSAARADLLEKLYEVLADTLARFQRPVKMAEVRVAGLDESDPGRNRVGVNGGRGVLPLGNQGRAH